MNEYITALDVETTGLSQKDDFIIQLSMIKFEKETFNVIKEFNHYIKPYTSNYTISPGAFEAHGLSKEFIEENGESLKSLSSEILDMLNDSDILTYNGNHFDINVLYKNLMDIGVDFPMSNKIFYDSYSIETKLNPRDLSSIYKKYTGKDLDGAHDSLVDVKATIEIFKHQLSTTEEDISQWPENKLYSPEGSIRNISNNDEEYLVFSVGKYKDCEFMDVCKKDPQYISWFKDKVASPYTWRLLSNYYRKHRND